MATATGVSTFIQKILDKKSGISASNLYSFNIQEPQQTSGYKLKTFFKDTIGFDSTAEELTLLCNEIQLPGITYSATDVKSVHKGIIQKMASGKVYNELDISFFLDADSMPLKFFRAWQDFTMGGKEIATDIYGDRAPTNRQQAFAMRYYNHYCCTLDIKKLEKYNVPKSESEEKTPPELKEVWEAKLFGAYPYTVSSIPYSAGPAQLVKVNVGFYYEYSQLKIN